MQNNRLLGLEQEQIACEYLIGIGYLIVQQNFFCRSGEIDIIAKDQKYLVFLEVKYRADASYGYPFEAVNYRKKNSLIQTARYYMHVNKIPEDTPCRFDVISILGTELSHIKHAFTL